MSFEEKATIIYNIIFKGLMFATIEKLIEVANVLKVEISNKEIIKNELPRSAWKGKWRFGQRQKNFCKDPLQKVWQDNNNTH